MNKIITDFTLNELIRQNPWWRDSSVLAEDPSKAKRKAYTPLLEKVTKRELITSLIGLRRVGKTTLIKQIINHFLLEKLIPPQNLLLFSFEEYGKLQKEETLIEIIEYQMAKRPKDKLFFFFDEIQYLNNWNAVLKRYFDQFSRLKFTITGSSSLFLNTSSQESLAGRIQEIILPPQSFAEYLSINKQINLPQVNFLETDKLLNFTDLLRTHFFEYLEYGEFPYLAKFENFSEKKEYLVNFIIDKIIEVDLPALKKIYHRDELKTLSEVLINNVGQVVEMQNLQTDIGLSAGTIREYLSLLEKTYLYFQIYNKGMGFRTRSLRQRKIYAKSTNALVLKTSPGTNTDAFNLKLGIYLENFVANYLTNYSGGEIFFWRKRQVKEVDFLLVLPDITIPIEVKAKNTIKREDLKNILFYCAREKLKEGIIITKDLYETKKFGNITIKYIPAYFLI